MDCMQTRKSLPSPVKVGTTTVTSLGDNDRLSARGIGLKVQEDMMLTIRRVYRYNLSDLGQPSRPGDKSYVKPTTREGRLGHKTFGRASG